MELIMLRPNLNLNHTKMCTRILKKLFVLEMRLRLRQKQLPPMRLKLAMNSTQLAMLKQIGKVKLRQMTICTRTLKKKLFVLEVRLKLKHELSSDVSEASTEPIVNEEAASGSSDVMEADPEPHGTDHAEAEPEPESHENVHTNFEEIVCAGNEIAVETKATASDAIETGHEFDTIGHAEAEIETEPEAHEDVHKDIEEEIVCVGSEIAGETKAIASDAFE